MLLFDSTVSIWTLATGAMQQIVRRGERDMKRSHVGGVNAVYLSSDGCSAVTVSKDCTARVWQLSDDECSTK